ncbi:MAG TPA: glutamate formimidoyltransferase [Chthonomonadales bacterium]|nr:glutamate formimidoyltransferase [Chthonomonadales bacterium]
MAALMECVPNISEGRRAEIIDSLADSLSGVPGVSLLDRSSDATHNRTVFTLVGEPNPLKSALVELVRQCIPVIDLRAHRGRHPRMGAVDVAPFIPLRNCAMKDCIRAAQEAGREIAERFRLPVYLYGEAAAAPDRALLANIRKGEFEGLEAKMKQAEWKPDYGPSSPHPSAGAIAVGARQFLIAYNIQLESSDLNAAKAIARAVRASSGGLCNVQAMGLLLEERNQTQVSMNRQDYTKTPIYRVQELVRAEAARFGIRIAGSEIVGLAPQAALLDSAAYYLQIENWRPELIIENAMIAATEPEQGVAADDRRAAGEPT